MVISIVPERTGRHIELNGDFSELYKRHAVGVVGKGRHATLSLSDVPSLQRDRRHLQLQTPFKIQTAHPPGSRAPAGSEGVALPLVQCRVLSGRPFQASPSVRQAPAQRPVQVHICGTEVGGMDLSHIHGSSPNCTRDSDSRIGHMLVLLNTWSKIH